MSNLKRCLDLLNENDVKVYTDVVKVLSTLCRNVIKNPKELKYRKVRLSNPIVAEKILPAVGAMECLFEIGFVENDDHLLLPENASLSKLQEFEKILSEPRASETNTAKINPPTQPASLPIQPTTSNVVTTSNKEAMFFKQIQGHFEEVLAYENEELQDKARSLVPLVDLEISAMEKMRLIQKDIKATGDVKSIEDVSMEDLVFAEVMKWFKEKFFKWVDSPDCSSCSGKCTFQRSVASAHRGISRIEIHRCGVCANTEEFPRYSDPALLLRSRKGRCGEWANAFALICRSLGYDTRLVWDHTDHVWVEIWSIAANRWIHADPCEDVMDRPLMYEKGWGKKLSYVIAFSKDEVQDVTWRYTSDQKSVMKRRNMCSEENLLSFTTSLTDNRRITSCSLPRQQYLVKRTLMELVELINCGDKKNDKDDYQGRTSGSLAWRLSRHETKIDSDSSHTWQIPADIKSVNLRYTASTDEYVIVDGSGKILEKKRGWDKGVYQMDGGIFRKVENDWKMVYLARSQGNDRAKIVWNFEINDSSAQIGSLRFKATTAVYHDAKVEWKLQGFYRSGKTSVLSINDPKGFETEQLKGAFKISLSAILSGGENELAWQHAQLFRQSLGSTEHSMEMNININELV